MNDRSDVVAAARFACAVCEQEAGHLQLFGSRADGELRRISFTSTLTARVPAAQFSRLRAAIERRDARALHRLDLEYAPFFCPPCDAVYCGDHWQVWHVFDEDWPSWHDSIRGRCPRGHERMLED